MKSITKRELNQQTARVLAEVDAGEAVVVTERGVPRWRIEAVDTAADPIERLRAAGRITAAKANPSPWPSPSQHPRYTSADVDALFADSRGDR